ncbi:MAG: glycosyltransferase, partial [Cetobacterium sp.]
MMKDEYLYIGFAVPQEEMEKHFKNDPFPSIQSNKFNWNIIKGLEYSKKYKIAYICATQVSNFPLYPKKYFSKKIWNVNIFGGEVRILEIPYINTEILKIITRFLSVMFYGVKEILKLKNRKGIIVCDIHIPFMLSGYILSKIFRVKYIAIWTDPPALSNERESGIKSKLRKIELNIAKFLMKRVDKVIAMTKYLYQDFAPGKPNLIVEGIVDELEICNKEAEKNNHEIKIVYTGSLEKRYGIENIVKGFQLINKENIVLEIYGRGDYEKELKSISETNTRIKYFGFVNNKKILNIQRSANFLINARDEKEKYTRYSFPSKM